MVLHTADGQWHRSRFVEPADEKTSYAGLIHASRFRKGFSLAELRGQCPSRLDRPNNETFGSRSDEVKGITGDESERETGRSGKHTRVGGLHNLGALHAILERSSRRRHRDPVVLANVFEWSKERISMASDAQVAHLAGEGSVLNMTRAKLECMFISSFEHNDGESETGNFEKPYGRSRPISVSAGSAVVSGPIVPAGAVKA